ncbi:hypothetical protein [Streptacidiphilus carbonis]|uniref:hypothetical protein n=1 Tax=Streptacidiphilus carbonis TaxID=105422 RepID=UPI00126A1624|nr:hypothetical protein [Streptacidiphilus carbonis]
MSSLRSVREFTTRIVARVTAATSEFRTPVVQPATQPELAEVEAAELFTDADMPPVADIETAAASYFRAADAARTADRQKRASKKVLSRLMPGRYGDWEVTREPSGRMVADLEEIRATYKRLGLGVVPMRSSAPSLKVRRVQLDTPSEAVNAEFVALAGVR